MMQQIRKPADLVEVTSFGPWIVATCVMCGELKTRGPIRNETRRLSAMQAVINSALVRDHPAVCKA
jgi:hypothetical protein